jgi:uncharacterized Fe-S cluster-containing MiaB family protein
MRLVNTLYNIGFRLGPGVTSLLFLTVNSVFISVARVLDDLHSSFRNCLLQSLDRMSMCLQLQ